MNDQIEQELFQKVYQNIDVLDTVKASIIIETITYAGSAFAVTRDGEQVFIHQRLVDKMCLAEGVSVYAHLLPNYPNKRDRVPWRAIRVTHLDLGQGPMAEEPAPEQADPADPEPEPKPEPELLPLTRVHGDRILELLASEDVTYLTTVEIAEELDLPVQHVSNACLSLFQRSLIARADIRSGPEQMRASLLLWAADTRRFTS